MTWYRCHSRCPEGTPEAASTTARNGAVGTDLADQVHQDGIVVADGVVVETPQVGRGQFLEVLVLGAHTGALIEPADEPGERAAGVRQHHLEPGKLVHH